MIYVAYDNNNSDLIYYGDFSNFVDLQTYMADLYNKCTQNNIDEIAIAIINLSDSLEDLLMELIRNSHYAGEESLVDYVSKFIIEFPENHWIVDINDFKDAQDFAVRASSWPDIETTL